MTQGVVGRTGQMRVREKYGLIGYSWGWVTRGGRGAFQPYPSNRGVPQNGAQQGMLRTQYPGDQHPFQPSHPLSRPPGQPHFGQMLPIMGSAPPSSSGGPRPYGVAPLQTRPDRIGAGHQGEGYPQGPFGGPTPTVPPLFTVPVGMPHQHQATGVFSGTNGSAGPPVVQTGPPVVQTGPPIVQTGPAIVQTGVPHNMGGPGQPMGHFAHPLPYSPPRANGVAFGDSGGGIWQPPGIPLRPGLQVRTLQVFVG